MQDPLAHPAPLIRRVYAYAAYRIGTGPDAEDVTSETFERALRYRDTYDAKRGDAAAWLLGIARRVIADRAVRGVVHEQARDEAVEGHELETVRHVDLAAAVGALPDRDREIIALRFGADMTTREIGRVMELRPNTVDVALHRALARLRSELGADQTSALARRGGAARRAGDAPAS